MTMHAIFFKENEGTFPDPLNGSQSEIPLWSVVGSQPPPPAFNNHYLQSKPPSLELSAGKNLKLAVAKHSDQDLQVLANKHTTHFTVFPGDCRTGESSAKMTHQTASMEQLKLGLGQPLICAQYPYNAEQWYGIYSAYGAQIEGRHMVVPLSMSSDGGPVFVNAKQYNGIMRRRRSRAKAESKNQEIKLRKPYMHLSRHLHAVRRQRGSGGRFLSSKCSKMENQHESTDHYSQISEVLESATSSPAASEVTSYLHHFEFDRLHPSFLDVGGTNFLKV